MRFGGKWKCSAQTDVLGHSCFAPLSQKITKSESVYFLGLQISLGGFWSRKGIFFLFSVSGVSETVLTELQTDGAREAMKGN